MGYYRLRSCGKCGGDLARDDGDWICLQCGSYSYVGLYSRANAPPDTMPGTLPDTLIDAPLEWPPALDRSGLISHRPFPDGGGRKILAGPATRLPMESLTL